MVDDPDKMNLILVNFN